MILRHGLPIQKLQVLCESLLSQLILEFENVIWGKLPEITLYKGCCSCKLGSLCVANTGLPPCCSATKNAVVYSSLWRIHILDYFTYYLCTKKSYSTNVLKWFINMCSDIINSLSWKWCPCPVSLKRRLWHGSDFKQERPFRLQFIW